jgi:hypothetical protein
VFGAVETSIDNYNIVLALLKWKIGLLCITYYFH